MPLDIAIAVILIFAMATGYRSGFTWSFLQMVGWVLSIVLAFVWAPKAGELLREYTGVYDFLHRIISERFSDAVSIDNLTAAFPALLRETVDSFAKLAAETAGTSITDLVFTIIAFLLTLILIKLLLFLLISLLSKRFHSGVRGFIDGILGLLLGFIKGAFIVFLMLAMMIPVMSMINPDLVTVITGWLDSSRIAGTLYDNNFLVLIVRDFLF